MADTLTHEPAGARRRPDSPSGPPSRPSPTTYVLRIIVTAYLFLLVAWPVSLVATNTFDDGLDVDPRASSRTPTSSRRSG